MFILDIADNSIFLLVYGFIMQYIFRVSCPTILRACKNAAIKTKKKAFKLIIINFLRWN